MNLSAWILLDCRILLQIPQTHCREVSISRCESTNPPLEIPAYEPALCPLYIKSTLNQRLIADLCLISYTKLRDFLLQSRIQTVGTIHVADQTQCCAHATRQCRTNLRRQLLFRRHVYDDSKYYVYTVSDKRKLNIKKDKRFLELCADQTLKCTAVLTTERGGG